MHNKASATLCIASQLLFNLNLVAYQLLFNLNLVLVPEKKRQFSLPLPPINANYDFLSFHAYLNII